MNKYYIDFWYYDGKFDTYDIEQWFCTANSKEEAVEKFVDRYGKYRRDDIVKIWEK